MWPARSAGSAGLTSTKDVRAQVMTWGPAEYGDEWAADYDRRFGSLTDTADAVTVLAELAGSGPVLELGVGTGRIAIPLAQQGIAVTGLDASQRMLDMLAAKPGGDGVRCVLGDFADVRLEQRYAVVFSTCNTLYSLPSQQQQLSAIRSAARHLLPEGLLVIEAGNPSALIDPPAIRVSKIEAEALSFEATTHDAVHQQIHRLRVRLTPEGATFGSIKNRYIWPGELDLMALSAGLVPAFRWGGWTKDGFTGRSGGHVSGYRLAEHAADA